ncbi:MAG TPA: hypothetical protein VLG76_01380 [Rhabdochlamydiaceae bacterium]|nr:hypothetical protein [Rhabdochlamydiaceae bacterium]
MTLINEYRYRDTTVTFTSHLNQESSKQPAGLSVFVQTPNLLMRSVDLSDTEDFCGLYDEKKPYQAIREKVGMWFERWEQNDPCSVLIVKTKDPSRFIGYLGLRDKGYGVAKLFGNGYIDYWEKYGLEATAAVTQAYVRGINAFCKPKSDFWKIIAKTEVEDNEKTNEILKEFAVGLPDGERVRYSIHIGPENDEIPGEQPLYFDRSMI